MMGSLYMVEVFQTPHSRLLIVELADENLHVTLTLKVTGAEVSFLCLEHFYLPSLCRILSPVIGRHTDGPVSQNSS